MQIKGGPLFPPEDMDHFSFHRPVPQNGQAEAAGRASEQEAAREGAEAWLRPRSGWQLAASKAAGSIPKSQDQAGTQSHTPGQGSNIQARNLKLPSSGWTMDAPDWGPGSALGSSAARFPFIKELSNSFCQ